MRAQPQGRPKPRRPKYIVSDDHEFVYFIVQKVACTSIKAALLPLFDIEVAEHKKTRKDGTVKSPGVHGLFSESAYQINKKRFTEKLNGEYADYFKFAFVRNPWDRLVSCYFDKLAKDRAGLNLPDEVDVELYPGMSFAEFVGAVCAIPDDQANAHFRSQYKVVCGEGRDKPVMADFVGRFENLVDDFAVVAQRIGAPELRLPHKMRSKSRESCSYTNLYDDRLKNLVYKRYQDDVEIFGYSY